VAPRLHSDAFASAGIAVMSSSHVFLVRHGRTALNAAGRLRGRLDPPLDDVGQLEAFELAQQLAYAHPVRIVTSPLLRAVQTALPLSRHANAPLVTEPRLADRDFGPWAGHRVEDVLDRWGSLDEAPEVEPSEEVLSRARAVLDEQVAHLDGGPVVLVAHDVVNRLLLASLDLGLGPAQSIPQRTGCWNVLLRSDGTWRVEQIDQRVDSNARLD
jgi:broad specificity phosphatase PhoE